MVRLAPPHDILHRAAADIQHRGSHGRLQRREDRAIHRTQRFAHVVDLAGVQIRLGYPGYDSVIGPESATIGEILKENGYATSWFGKDHNTPGFTYSTTAGPFAQWPIGMGFQYFYGFLGGETDQWTPYLFRNTEMVT